MWILNAILNVIFELKNLCSFTVKDIYGFRWENQDNKALKNT